ncbi:MAG: hypothetical protein ACE5KQ_03920 [Thermoplasmata archaeon]
MAFLWALVEMVRKPNPAGVRRAQYAAIAGLAFVAASWVLGGYYYVSVYGASVKPLIKEGPAPWAHLIFMETKEHVFLFLPFIGGAAAAIAFTYGGRLSEDSSARKGFLALTGLSVLMVLGVGMMGFIVSTGYRDSLEAMHLLTVPLALIGLAAAATAPLHAEVPKPAFSERIPLWGVYAAAIFAMVLVTALTIGSELNAGLKGWLAASFGHHWVGKGVLATVSFGVIVGGAMLLRRKRSTRVYRGALLTFASAFLLGAIILAFYAYEYLY